MTRAGFSSIVDATSILHQNRRLVAIVAPVPHGRIGLLEQVARTRDSEPYHAHEPVGVTSPAKDTDIGYYLFYVWAPDKQNETAWTGLNIGAWPAVHSFLDEVMATNKPAAIPLPMLGHDIAPSPGNVMIATPIVTREGPRRAVIVQIVDMGAVMRSIAETHSLSSLNLQVRSSWNQGKISEGFSIRHQGTEVDNQPLPKNQAIWQIHEKLQLGPQVWDLTPWAPLRAFRVDYGPAVITASVCLLLTGLVLFIVWSQSERAKRVVEIVNRRTRALKEAHEELEEHYKLLQNLNKDVEEARQSAETANRAKSEFLATMSHELRTPLNAILGFSQLLREQPLGDLGDARYVEYAVDIHTSGSHLLSLINDILDLAKLEAGKINIERKVVDTRALVDRVLTLLGQQAEDKGIEFKAEVAEAMPSHIWGDELRLRQIMINLASNAIKFTNKGSVVIRLLPKPFANGQAGWVLEVQDTGIGIPEDKQSTLFDRFTQVDPSLSRRHGGVGLGLAICRELVDRMHGKISVRSIPDVGTTIRAHLPLEPADAEDVDDMMI
nr:ATP-binding protein [Kordiimonas marina]